MTSSNLTKTCSICGQLKPMSAFLQLTKSGALYGNICGVCRSKQKGLKEQKETGGSTTETSRKQLDSKAKLKLEEEIREHKEEVEEIAEEQQEEKEEKQQRQAQRTETIKKQARAHHQSFLDSRNAIESKHAQIDIQNTPADIAAREEKLDLGHSVVDTQPKLKTQSPYHEALKKWLGASAPIITAAEKAAQNLKKANATQKVKKELNKTQEKLIELTRKSRR